MTTMIIAYVVLSIMVGLKDLARARRQERDLNSFAVGDYGYYVEPKAIFGIHNWVFFPSWIVIILAIAGTKLVNKVF